MFILKVFKKWMKVLIAMGNTIIQNRKYCKRLTIHSQKTYFIIWEHESTKSKPSTPRKKEWPKSYEVLWYHDANKNPENFLITLCFQNKDSLLKPVI